MSGRCDIVFMNAIPAPVFRGGEKWMVTAGRALADRGQCIRCVGRPGSAWLRAAEAARLDTVAVPLHADLDPVCIVRLFLLFRKRTPHVLCCNFEKDLRTGGIAARLAGVPAVFVRKGLALIYPKLRYRLTYRYLVDGIITPARFIRRRFERFGWIDPACIHVIPNGVDVPDVTGWDRGMLRRQIGAGPGDLVVLGAGSLFSQKGFETLIEAGAICAREGMSVRIAIAGAGEPGPYREYARARGIGDRVHFLGFRVDLPRLMFGADIFALSSIDEGMPNVVLEAMSVGTPVVATDAGGTAEIITDGRTGLIVPVGESAALAARLRELGADPALRGRLGAAGRRRVADDFPIAAMAGRLEQLFASYTGAAS